MVCGAVGVCRATNAAFELKSKSKGLVVMLSLVKRIGLEIQVT